MLGIKNVVLISIGKGRDETESVFSSNVEYAISKQQLVCNAQFEMIIILWKFCGRFLGIL